MKWPDPGGQSCARAGHSRRAATGGSRQQFAFWLQYDFHFPLNGLCILWLHTHSVAAKGNEMRTIRKLHRALWDSLAPTKPERAALALAEAEAVYLRDLI